MYLALHGRAVVQILSRPLLEIKGWALDAKSFLSIFESLPFVFASVREKPAMKPPACLLIYAASSEVII
jgi:hypothetical protein